MEEATRDHATAEATIKDLGGDTTSIVGLEKPLFDLKNPA